MATELNAVLVLRDSAGHHYVFTEEMVASAAVPPDQEPEIERMLAGEEVAGFSFGAAPPPRQEALLNIIANGMEILGIAWGGPTMIMGFTPSSQAPK